MSPMTITPDDKDWTWVLDRPCPECGFEAGTFDRTTIGDQIRDVARRWEAVLAAPGVARRPRPDRWSALEYGCHVRDVFRIYDERLRLMLTEDDPLYQNWDQDQTALDDRYGEQDPTAVATELVVAAEAIAQRFGGVTGADWSRPGRRSDGASFTVDTFARYFIHDLIHHLHDVGAGE